MFEGTALETWLAPVAALLVTVLLTWGCATSTSFSTPTAPPVLAQDAYVYVQERSRPGAVKYTNGMTLRQAIAQAGSLTSMASPRTSI